MVQFVKKSFSINLTIMRVLGFYPPQKYKNFYKLYAYFVYCLMTIPVPTLAAMYLVMKENVTLAQIGDSAFLICQVGCFIAKFVPFWSKSAKIRRNIELLDRPIFINHPKKHQDIIENCIRINNRNCCFNLFLVVTALVSWAINPILFNTHKLPVEIWLPYDISTHPVIFVSIYIFIVVGVGNGAIASGVIDPLIAGLAHQATAQLKILKDNLQYLNQYVDEDFSRTFGDNFESSTANFIKAGIMYKKIKYCIKHHNAILRYVDDYEKTYSFVVFVQFTASVLVICNACLQLSMVEPFTYIFFQMISFLITMLTEIFLYSFYGTTLSEESFTLSEAVYMSEWYTYDKKCKEALIILMERSKRPIIVTAGKILDLSLVTFTTILRRAYSLLAVLKNY